MGGRASAHYAALASNFEQNWAYSPAFVRWVAGELITVLRLTPAARFIDVGCGTGLFAREILDLASLIEPITCVDPSEEMLAQLPADPRLRSVRASAEQIASSGRASPLPGEPFDAILVKEVIHHVLDANRQAVIGGLARLLVPGGRLLVVMFPTRIDYPLFGAALERFSALQPDPEVIAAYMRSADLAVELTYHSTILEIPRDRYLTMVRARYMSLLSLFSDDEIEAGAREIAERHPESVLTFSERFAFVLGTRADG